MSIRLGDKITDSVTGLTGIAWCRTEYLGAEDQYGLMLPAQDGKPGDIFYCDERRLLARSIQELQELRGESEAVST